MITARWEVDAFIYLLIALVLWTICEFCWAYWRDRRRWRGVQGYYGRPYDASVGYRPNMRRPR